jgi:drug/metabolite transporter (DMT)-like permease
MQGAIYYLLTVLIWGSTWFAIKFQLGVVDESVSLVYRFGLAAALLLAWCVVRRMRLRFTRVEHLAMAAQGACLFSTNYLLFYWCTGLITSGLVAIIFSTVIVMNIINGAIFLKRRVQGIVLVGALVGLLGITLVFWHEILASQAESLAASGNVLTGNILKGLGIGLVATYSASLGNILSARNQQHGLPVLQTNAFGMAYGALLMGVYAFFTAAPFAFEWSVPYVSSLLYLSVFGSIIAFGAYLTLVGRIGADRAAYATVLFPLVALVLSSLFEGFEWTAMALVGVALVLIGNVLVVGRGLGARWRRRVAVA